MPMTLETLHPDILESEQEIGRKTIKVIDPGASVWGETIEGLITIVYECTTEWCRQGITYPHTHEAIYGWADEISPESGYSLYAD